MQQWKDGGNRARIENAQNLPGRAFQRHNVDIQQSVEEIKVGHEGFYIMVLTFNKS